MTESRVAAPDGALLAVTVEGDGPPLLLIPGLGATRVVFRPLMPLLTAHFRVAVYDQRGIGGSQLTTGPYTTAQLAGDAVAVLDALSIDRATVLGGSFGGLVAQEVAVGYPDRLHVLVLAATGPGRAHLVEEPDPAAVGALLGKSARSPEEAYRIACTVLYSREFQEAHPDFIEQQISDRATRPIDGRAFRAQLDASRGHDAWDGLSSIAAPTLVLHGSEDAVIPLANARLLAERIPGATMVVFDGAGHLFFHEEPERTAAVIVEFVSGVSSRLA
ncbi:MAG: alpha/beta fold hydrolase [Candidatus Dormibacter sp.]